MSYKVTYFSAQDFVSLVSEWNTEVSESIVFHKDLIFHVS